MLAITASANSAGLGRFGGHVHDSQRAAQRGAPCLNLIGGAEQLQAGQRIHRGFVTGFAQGSSRDCGNIGRVNGGRLGLGERGVHHTQGLDRRRPHQGVGHERPGAQDRPRHPTVDQGYHGLSLEQVAEDAGITRVTIYRPVRFQARSPPGRRRRPRPAWPSRRAPRRRGHHPRCLNRVPVPGQRAVPLLGRRPPAVPPHGQPGRRGPRSPPGDRDPRTVALRRDHHPHRAAGQRRPFANPFSADQAIAITAAVTSFPACDQIATILGVSFIRLPELLLPLLGAVLNLKPPDPSKLSQNQSDTSQYQNYSRCYGSGDDS